LQPQDRYDFLAPYLAKAGFDTSDHARTEKIIDAAYKRLSFGAEIGSEAAIFYSDNLVVSEEEARIVLSKSTAKRVLVHFLGKLDSVNEINVDIFRTIMKQVQQETGISKEELWMPIRVALTGVTHGPDLPMVIEIFGKEKISRFVKQAMEI
jgi:nondiscriminating glutamyl-tRNA synthetase